MIEAGRLNKKISIESNAAARDSHGQDVESWSPHLTDIWASIDPVRGREFFAARQFNAEVTHKVTIRYRTGISPQMRVEYQGRYFRIEAVIDPNERHEALELMCVEAPA
jgi:SPP1 family predicted phage head-tail adaptor